MKLVSQARAVLWLLVAHFRRASVRPKAQGSPGRTAIVFRIFVLLVFANMGRNAGVTAAASSVREAATAWLGIALFGFGVGGGLRTSAPEVRGIRPTLSAQLLEALPISEWIRIPLSLLESERVFAVALGVAAGASSDLGGESTAFATAASLAMAIATSGLLWGVAIGRILRVILDPLRLARLGIAMAFGELIFLFPLMMAPALGHVAALDPIALLARPVSDALLGAAPVSLALLRLVPAALAAAVVIAVMERIGYDRGDVVPTRHLRAAASTDLTLDRVETVLARREGGRWIVWITVVYSFVIVGGAFVGAETYGAELGRHPDALPAMVRVVAVLVALVASSGAFGRATRIAARDAIARPLLAPLPIAPGDLLAGKARAMRTPVLIAGATIFALIFAPLPLALRIEVALRGAALLAGLALHVEASAAVAFLTQGLGTARPTSGFRIESFLLAIPLLSVASSTSAFQVAVSLASLALVTLAAKRAAVATVRWIDDADEDVGRETSTWRALLAFAVFQAGQAIGARALAASTELSPSSAAAIGYAISAAALGLLTYRARPESARSMLPAKSAWLAAGALAGGVTGLVGVGYAHVLERLGVDRGPELLASASGAGRAMLVFTVVGMAPPLEEIFFRGWLQPSIADDLAPRRAWLAPWIGAFAFAAVHPPISFVPVFALGVAASFLYQRTRAVGPGMLAHLAHNAIVVALLARG